MMEDAMAYSPFVTGCLFAAAGLPLTSFFISLLVSERYAWSVSALAPFLMLLAAIASFVVAINVWGALPLSLSIDWFSVGDKRIGAGILVNDLSALMLAVVSLISFLVHVFSIGYMAGDDGEKRYFGMLGLFTFAMLGIVLADNLLLIFVFWELVGFSSYMLIGHWRSKPEAAAASSKAFVLNRIGDAGFLVGLMILWAGGTNFAIDGLQPVNNTALNTAAALCLFCGVIGKSAQLPLSTWLPDAMQGPTPVSALIHAATMVAAGVFLLARVFPLFTTDALEVVGIVGIASALVAALAALSQSDMKKVLAYSTMSQLGLMVTAVGAGAWEAAMLHLFTHAFFKACLFLCAGSVIHALHQATHQSHVDFDVQDMRKLGGLRKRLPFTFIATLVSGASLAGIPFLSGFISKEGIFTGLFVAMGDSFNLWWVIFVAAFAVSFLTVFYIARFVYMIFLGPERETSGLVVAEPPHIMRAPVALLMALSIWLAASINPFDSSGYFFGSGEHFTGLTIFSAAWVIFSLAFAYFLISRNVSTDAPLLRRGFYLDDVQEAVIRRPVLALSVLTESVDKRWIDGALHGVAYAQVTLSHLAGWFDRAIVDGAVNGVASLARLTGSFTRSFQGGKIQLYIFWAIFAIIIFLIWSLI